MVKGKNMDSSETFNSKGGMKITKEMVKGKNMDSSENFDSKGNIKMV